MSEESHEYEPEEGEAQKRGYNAGDPGQVKAAKKARKLQDMTEDELLGRTLDTYEGRAVVWKLLETCHVFATSHRAESTHQTAFLEGERNVGLQIWADVLRVRPKVYPVMSGEAAEREKR